MVALGVMDITDIILWRPWVKKTSTSLKNCLSTPQAKSRLVLKCTWCNIDDLHKSKQLVIGSTRAFLYCQLQRTLCSYLLSRKNWFPSLFTVSSRVFRANGSSLPLFQRLLDTEKREGACALHGSTKKPGYTLSMLYIQFWYSLQVFVQVAEAEQRRPAACFISSSASISQSSSSFLLPVSLCFPCPSMNADCWVPEQKTAMWSNRWEEIQKRQEADRKKREAETKRQEAEKKKSEENRALVQRSHIKTYSSRVYLDVGGGHFTTSLQTLTRYPDSLLGIMFSDKHRDTLSLASFEGHPGRLTIDRDGDLFR